MADSIREALTAAMEAAPADEPKVDTTPVAEPAADTTPAKDAVSGTAVGDAKVSVKDPSKVGAPDTRPPEAEKPAEPVAKVGTPDPTGPQPPASWTAEEKAAWTSLPRQAQTAILRRETDLRKAVHTASEARKTADEYTKVLEPFQPLFESRKVPPAQAVREVMGMAAVLLTGTKEQKAALIGNMIKVNGVDIALLDSILAGETEVPLNQPEPPPPAWAQKLMQLSNKLEETAKERSERLDAEAAAAIQAAATDTAKYPHFERVRENIADVLEMAKNRGVDMTLEQAYDRAVAWDPELRDIEAQKARASTVSDAARTLAASRKASTSVAGAPVQAGAPKPSTIRESLIAAMDGR